MSAAATGRTGAFGVDIAVASSLWRQEPKARATVRRALRTAAKQIDVGGASVSVMLTDDATLQDLNRRWRGQDKATNVLSFPSPRGADDAPGPLGDIAVAYETLAREAETEKKPFLHHLSHLAVHGFLHLTGHDHELEVDAEAMEALERKVLASLGISDPYR